jgi:hypothetical protein
VIYGKEAVAWDHFDPALPFYQSYAPFSKATLAAMSPDAGNLGEC